MAAAGLGCDQADPDDGMMIVDDGDGDGPGNGGEPGDGDSPVPNTTGDAGEPAKVTTAELIYPLVAGSSWKYRHMGGSASWVEQVTLEEEEYEGEPVLMLKDTAGPSGDRSESIIALKGTTAYRVHKWVYIGQTLQMEVDYDPGFTRGDQTWTTASADDSEPRTYRRVEWDGEGQQQRDGERTHVFEVEGTDETVTVPAGEFTGCVVVHRVRDRGMDPLADDDDKRFWYCPGIGKVKELSDGDGKREELMECDVPGGSCP